MKKTSLYYEIALISILVVGAICAGTPFIAAPPGQMEPTARQMTVDARVNVRFTQTAVEREEAILEQTVDAAFDFALTATAQSHRSQDSVPITLDNARHVNQIAAITGVVRLEGIALSPNGEALVWISSDNVLHLWNLRTAEQSMSLRKRNPVVYIEFSPDGSMMATANRDEDIHLWDTETGDERSKVPNPDGLGALKFSPDGILLALGDLNGAVRLWNMVEDEVHTTLRGHRGRITGVVFNRDGTLLATGGEDGNVLVWDVTVGEQLSVIGGVNSRFGLLRFSPDGRRLAVFDNTARLWDVATGVERVNLSVQFATFSPDLTWLAYGIGDSETGAIQLFDVTSGAEMSVLIHDGVPVGFTPDNGVVVTGGGDNTIRLWNVETGAQLSVLRHEDLSNVAFSPDGRYIATWGLDNTIRIWGVPVEL